MNIICHQSPTIDNRIQLKEVQFAKGFEDKLVEHIIREFKKIQLYSNTIMLIIFFFIEVFDCHLHYLCFLKHLIYNLKQSI